VAIATANLARVSRDVARQDRAALRANLAAALRAAALLTIPATAGLIALRQPIVRLLFEHGRFAAEDTAATAGAVLCYALGLYAYAVTKIQVPTFYALAETRTPVKASVAAVLSKIVASFLLIALLARAGVSPFLGLALSTSLAAWVNMTWLAIALRRKVGPLEGERVLGTFARMLVVGVTTGLVCAGLHAWLERVVHLPGTLGELVRLAPVVAAGGILALVAAHGLGVKEARLLGSRLRGR
jgi:putative peptidoglycan lipid II flippase